MIEERIFVIFLYLCNLWSKNLFAYISSLEFGLKAACKIYITV